MNVDEFNSHAIHPLLEQLTQKLSELTNTESEISHPISEFAKQTSYLKWCISKSDPELISLSILDGLVGRLTNVESGVRTFESAKAQADSPQRRNSLANSFQAIRSNLEAAMADFSYPRIQQIFRSEATSAIDQTNAVANEAITALNRLQAEQSKSITEQTTKLANKIKEQTSEIETQNQKIKELQRLNATFEASIQTVADGKSKAFDNLIEERQTQLYLWQNDVEKEGNEFLGKIKSFYRMSGDTTLAGRFIQASREERNSYYALTVLSLLFFLGAICVLLNGATFVERILVTVVDGPWVTWLTRVSLVAVFFVPATIFSAQAGKHRRASIWYRTLGVRVATLKPYLDEFRSEGLDYADELKSILTTFFMSELNSESSKPQPMIDQGIIELFFEKAKKYVPK